MVLSFEPLTILRLFLFLFLFHITSSESLWLHQPIACTAKVRLDLLLASFLDSLVSPYFPFPPGLGNAIHRTDQTESAGGMQPNTTLPSHPPLSFHFPLAMTMCLIKLRLSSTLTGWIVVFKLRVTGCRNEQTTHEMLASMFSLDTLISTSY
ncbi:hypothetical protein V8C37DRAFT_174272 [Trichoderma ceciliae]